MSGTEVAVEIPPVRVAGGRSMRLSRLTALGLFVTLTIWTALILATPFFHFDVSWPEARPPIESVGFVILTLTCALAYIRYSFTQRNAALFIALAFLVLASNHLVFGVIIGAGNPRVSAQQYVYFWWVGRVVAVFLLLVGLARPMAIRDTPRPLRDFALRGLGALAALGVLQGVLWAMKDRLPALTTAQEDVSAALASGPLPGLSAIDIAMGASGTLLYLAAALSLLSRDGDVGFRWLPAALIIAAFSHLHNMFFPTVFSSRISTADFLRLAFSGYLLAGLLYELHQLYEEQRSNTERIAQSYRAERQRVEELERLDRAKAELFGLLTHELMHPIATIRGFAVTLRKRWDTLDEPTRRIIVDRLDRQSELLRDFSEDIASATNLDSPGFSLVKRPELAADLIRDASEAVDDLQGRLSLVVAPEAAKAQVDVDRSRILQVFRNLLSNADKYSDPDTPIELHATDGNEQMFFAVVNTGPGIPEEQMPRLFQRFARTRPSGKEHVGGSGLGLYICRRIVEDHGGRIWAESELHEETSFFFSVPVAGESG